MQATLPYATKQRTCRRCGAKEWTHPLDTTELCVRCIMQTPDRRDVALRATVLPKLAGATAYNPFGAATDKKGNPL